MNKLYIMTWNTSLYTEKPSMPICKRYRGITNKVKEYLLEHNSVCFLQEIPYFSNETWKEHILFLELKKDFPEEEYDMKYNLTKEKQIMMTVAIAKKGLIKEVENASFNTNRTVTIQYADVKITGLHADNEAYNRKYLEDLNRCSSEIILGDFNAGNYDKCENRAIFNEILEEYICICNIVTRVDPNSKRRTCIDHVFVKDKYVTYCSNMIVHENAEFSKLSDHFPLTFEMILPD